MPPIGWPYSVSDASCFSTGLEFSQALNWLILQWKQPPQLMVKGTTTRCPLRRVLDAPVSTTSPMNSCPRMSPGFTVGMTPS